MTNSHTIWSWQRIQEMIDYVTPKVNDTSQMNAYILKPMFTRENSQTLKNTYVSLRQQAFCFALGSTDTDTQTVREIEAALKSCIGLKTFTGQFD